MKKYILITLLLLSLASCWKEASIQNNKQEQEVNNTMVYTALINQDIWKLSEKVYIENNIPVDTENFIYIKDIADFKDLDSITWLAEWKAIIYILDNRNNLYKDTNITKITKEEFAKTQWLDLATGFIILWPKSNNINIWRFFETPQPIKWKKYNWVFLQAI